VRQSYEVIVMKQSGVYQPGVLLLAFLILIVGGCGPKSTRPPTHKVSGVVTLGGRPLEAAVVTFRPTANQQPANGITNAEGRYALTTFSRGDGAMAGAFQVTVVKYGRPDQNSKAGSSGSASDGEENYVPVMGPTPEPKNILPRKYADASSSGISAEVQAGQENTFDFVLDE